MRKKISSPEEYKFQEDKQFIFEGILYSALTLYNTGGASRSRIAESHKRFVQEIQKKNEEKLSRTQQLTTIKFQALRELGYDEFTRENASEILEKIAEIDGLNELKFELESLIDNYKERVMESLEKSDSDKVIELIINDVKNGFIKGITFDKVEDYE